MPSGIKGRPCVQNKLSEEERGLGHKTGKYRGARSGRGPAGHGKEFGFILSTLGIIPQNTANPVLVFASRWFSRQGSLRNAAPLTFFGGDL